MPQFVHPFIQWRTFHLLAIVNSVAMNASEQVFVWISVFNYCGCLSRSGIAGSYGNYILQFLRNYQTLWYSGFTILYSHQESTRFQLLYILTNTCNFLFVLFLNDSHHSMCEMVSHRGFDLHFFNDQWSWISFHMFIGHFYIFFRECLFKSFDHILIEFFVISFLCIRNIRPLSDL